MKTKAVVMTKPRKIALESLYIKEPEANEVVVDVQFSGISTGTEKLFWNGDMPSFPGMGYPLVPGYESVGEVVEAPKSSIYKTGDTVFVPGANCFGEVKGLFGGASKQLVTAESRLIKIDPEMREKGALFALAATARHAIAGFNNELPDLIVGHGVLGRLLARMTLAAGGNSPTVWELDPVRRAGAVGYNVIHPDADLRTDYRAIYDVSGDEKVLDKLIRILEKSGEIVLAGFYPGKINFTFATAFLKEARFRISSEFNSDDISATRSLIEAGSLSLDGLVTDVHSTSHVVDAYEKAFSDPNCLKMILDWRNVA
jgi:3-hydroxyethyl bacteriochlorophyllide a dehydrogenase